MSPLSTTSEAPKSTRIWSFQNYYYYQIHSSANKPCRSWVLMGCINIVHDPSSFINKFPRSLSWSNLQELVVNLFCGYQSQFSFVATISILFLFCKTWWPWSKKNVTNLLEKLSCLIQQVSFFKVETLGCFQFLKGQILVSLLHSKKKGMQALLGLVARLGTLLNLQGPLRGPLVGLLGHHEIWKILMCTAQVNLFVGTKVWNLFKFEILWSPPGQFVGTL